MSQTGARATTGARSLLQAANHAFEEAKVHEETKKETKTEPLSLEPHANKQDESNKKPSADSIAAKRDWCVSQMTPNFFATPTAGNPKEPSVEALD